MTTWVVLSTGPSMSQAVADSVRHLPRVVVNVNFRIAPDAQAIVASDTAFWREYPEALKFAGRKFTSWKVRGVDQIRANYICGQTCSGVLALEVAKNFGATRVLLFGMDFSGGHYFGEYKGACKRATPTKWGMHRNQFRTWRKANRGIEVLNCTPGSKLDLFPHVSPEAALASS